MNKSKYQISLSVVLFVLIGMSGVWIFQIRSGFMPYVDQWTRDIVPRFADTSVYTFFRWVTELGSQSFVIPFTIIMVVVLAIIMRDWLTPLTFGLGVLGTHLINTVMKGLVARERPSISALLNAEGHSFPSGHATISMVCYGFLMFLIVRKLKDSRKVFWIQAGFALLIFLIGISRFFINVHYLTDVVAGFTLGFLCLLGLMRFYTAIENRRSPQS